MYTSRKCTLSTVTTQHHALSVREQHANRSTARRGNTVNAGMRFSPFIAQTASLYPPARACVRKYIYVHRAEHTHLQIYTHMYHRRRYMHRRARRRVRFEVKNSPRESHVSHCTRSVHASHMYLYKARKRARASAHGAGIEYTHVYIYTYIHVRR